MAVSEKKLTIVSLDSPKIRVTAQFNPKEISIDKSVPWSKHGNAKSDAPELEFTNGENRSMSLELFFDGYEKKKSVLPDVEKLHSMSKIREGVSKESEKHPPQVLLTWGPNFPKFSGVIESLSTKYTMFLEDGTPVRATCTLKIKETSNIHESADSQEPA